MFGALLRIARLRTGRVPFAVAEPSVRGQRYRLFRGRAHRRFRVLVITVVVELFVLVVLGVAHRSLSAVRLAAVLARAAALAITVRRPVVGSRVHHVGGTCGRRQVRVTKER